MALQERTARVLLSAPTGTQSGSFNVIASFREDVSNFDSMNIEITPDAVEPGNGTSGVSFQVSGSGAYYNIFFVIPDARIGKFIISLVGMVDLRGASVELSGGLSLVISYDTQTTVSATFGDLVYSRNGEIRLPVNFAEAILYFHKTDARIDQIFGDAVYDMEFSLIKKEGFGFEFVFLPMPDRQGLFKVALTGYVFRTATSIRDDVKITPKLVPYDTHEVYVVNANIPDVLSEGVWDIFIELSAPAIEVGISDFDIEFADDLPEGFLEDVELYRAKSLDVQPSRPSGAFSFDAPADYIGDWVRVSGDASTVEGRYFILRFNVPRSLAGEVLSITPRQGVFGKPVFGG